MSSSGAMADLFEQLGGQATRIELPDADLLFLRQALPEEDARRYFELLHKDTPWREEDVFVWGKRHKQPRLIAWYGDPGAAYSYSGSTLEPLPWTDALKRLRSTVEKLSGARFNSVLLNLYRNEADRMGWHSDDEKALGPAPTVASLSLGTPRIFQMKHKQRRALGIRSIELTNGSLLVMSGPTQKFWLHAIKKESVPLSPRINLTFRRIIL